jgi:hypothetical protein
MLMMVDKQVYFHVLPKYENPIEILGEKWKDENWFGVPDLLVNLYQMKK